MTVETQIGQGLGSNVKNRNDLVICLQINVMMHQVQYWLCDLVELGGWPRHQVPMLSAQGEGTSPFHMASWLADLYYMDTANKRTTRLAKIIDLFIAIELP